MPIFSEHISNMYYSGCPSYISSPYSYSSSFTPSGISYSASYLNSGGSYSNHSSMGGYSRTPITSRWIPSGRSYSPMLSTISERGTSTPVRITSPRRVPIQNRSNRAYVSANYTSRPVNINTADIDVSRDKYRNKIQSKTDDSTHKQKENSDVHRDKSPLTPRVEEKPETGIDTSPGTQRGAIKRERTVVRLHTLKRKERNSPRKPVNELQKNNDGIHSEKGVNDYEKKEEIAQTKKWREKLSEDLVYKDTREKKTLGEKLVEKFQVKNRDTDVSKDTKIVPSITHASQKEKNKIINSKSPDRRCSMELLAEQACLFDSLIRKENLSTATLDLSKIGTSESLDGVNSLEKESSDNSKEFESKNMPLTTTKSDHSLHNRLNNLRDQSSKRRSVKKSLSGGNISKLDSITEFPKDFNEKILPGIGENRQSLKIENFIELKPPTKPIIKTKITSTVAVTPPSTPLRFKVENITVEEKPRTLRKEVMFSSEVENGNTLVKNKTAATSTKKDVQEDINDPASPEPEDGNFWNKIGKRETVYLLTRKQKLEKSKEKEQRSLFWYPEEEVNEKVTDDSNNKNKKDCTDKIDEYIPHCNETKINSEFDKTTEDIKEKFKPTNISQIPTISCGLITGPITKASADFQDKISSPIELVENKELSFTNNLENIEIINNETELSIIGECQSYTKDGNAKHIDVRQNFNRINDNLSELSTKRSSLEQKEMTEKKSLTEQVTSDKRRKIKKISPKKKNEVMEETHTKNINNEFISNTNEVDITNSNNFLNSQNEIGSAIKLEKNIVETHSTNLLKNNEKNMDKEINNNAVEMCDINTLKKIESKSLKTSIKESPSTISEKNEENKDLCNENFKSLDKNKIPELLSETENIPNNNNEKCIETKNVKAGKNNETLSDSKKENEKSNTTQASVKLLVNTKPVKPVKEQKALKPLIATPRPLQKKIPQLIRSTSTSGTSSDDETSEDDKDEEESNSSEDSNEFFECENQDGRTSTGSNDSGFDSSASASPAGFNCVRKDCDVNCHRKCEKLTANLCGVNQRLLVEALATRTVSRKGGDCPSTSTGNPLGQTLGSDILEQELEQSTVYGLFKKTGRFTPPARSIPRFRKYTIEDFQFIKVLGKGSFGKVLLAELRDTEYYYAVKCLKKDVVLEDDDVECTLIERKVLALGTNHPYLCHLFATFQTDSHLFFVMEYLNGGDLMFHIQQSGRFPEPRARFYAAEIVSGLKFLHKRGIIYRDLKLDNILLDFDGHVRIADFGMCKLQIYLDKTADTFCGTPDYMAPEIIKGLKYNQTVDWWSFGVLLYEMLIGQSPFSGCDEDELFWSICNEMPSYPRFLSQEALSILTRLLDKDARSRLGGAECMHGDIRDQDFFHSVAWDRLERRELEAPFKPRVRHPLDTQYFDRTFTGERPRLTAVEPHVLRSMDQEPFRGFSYTNPNATDR